MPDKENLYFRGWKYADNIYTAGMIQKAKEPRVYEAIYKEYPKITYSLDNATVSGILEFARPNEIIPFIVTLEDGYLVKSVSIQTADGVNVQYISNGSNSYSFEVPYDDVAITILTSKKDYPVTYKISFPKGAACNVSVSFFPTLSSGGGIWDEEYDMTITLPATHIVTNVSALGASFIQKDENAYSFVMPKRTTAIMISIEPNE